MDELREVVEVREVPVEVVTKALGLKTTRNSTRRREPVVDGTYKDDLQPVRACVCSSGEDGLD